MKTAKSIEGFTLIELLVTILVLALVAGFAIYIGITTINKSKDKSYEVTINNIENEASNYIKENIDRLSFVKKNDIEYQCVSIQNLIDAGYFNESILQSSIEKDKTVSKGMYVYLERDVLTKAINKTILVKDSSSEYSSYCVSVGDASGNILINIEKNDEWTKSKIVTINYNVKNAMDISDYEYTYSFSGTSKVVADEGNYKKIELTTPGTVTGTIKNKSTGGDVLSTSRDVQKIDNVPPTCKLSANGTSVSFASYSDNVKLKSYGLNTTGKVNYNSIDDTDIAVGKYYGYVIDEAGNEGTCSTQIENTIIDNYTVVTQQCDQKISSYNCSKAASLQHDCPAGYYHCETDACQCYKYAAAQILYNRTVSYCYRTTSSFLKTTKTCKCNSVSKSCSGLGKSSCQAKSGCYWGGIFTKRCSGNYSQTSCAWNDSYSTSAYCNVGSPPTCNNNNSYVSSCSPNYSYYFANSYSENKGYSSCNTTSFTCNSSTFNSFKVVGCSSYYICPANYAFNSNKKSCYYYGNWINSYYYCSNGTVNGTNCILNSQSSCPSGFSVVSTNYSYSMKATTSTATSCEVQTTKSCSNQSDYNNGNKYVSSCTPVTYKCPSGYTKIDSKYCYQ